MPRDHDLRSLVGEASLEALARQAPYNVDSDEFDRAAFDAAAVASPKLQALLDEGAGVWPVIYPLMQDVFACFYRMAPSLLPKEGRDLGALANRPWIERIIDAPATVSAREGTALDDLAAAVATLETGRRLLEEIRNRPSLQAVAKAGRRLARLQGETRQQALDAYQAAVDEAAFDLRRAVQAAVRAGQEAAEDVQAQIAAWGLDPAEVRAMPIGDRLRLAERLRSEKMRRMAELIGRLRNLARARQRERLLRRSSEIHSITIGWHLDRALPSELAQLRHPLRRLELLRRLQDGRVLEYELRNRERLAKGPMLVAIDTSGSMAGERQAWAVAVALALADMARRERRGFGACAFNATVAQEWYWPLGKAPADAILSMATLGSAGGTQFGPPVEWALMMLRTREFRRADLVIITDGESELDKARREALLAERRRGLRVYGILIGQESRELVQWCDRVWQVRAAGDDEVAAALFDEIATEVNER